MSSVPAELRYTKEHEWIQEISATKFRFGITDYAQSALGDIVYIQLPKNGSSIAANSVCGEVESTKSVSEIYAPITGKVVLVNEKLESNPEIINTDPYGSGWIAEIEISTDSLRENLLSAQEYQSLTAWPSLAKAIVWASSWRSFWFGGDVADKATPPKDLTSTLHLRQLRSIPQAGLSEDLLKSLSVEQKNVVTNLPKGEGILLVLKGAGVGARFLLDASETKIGRDTSNQIQLDDITVSRSHAMISKKDGYHIRDLGSLNGTYLNAVAVRDSKINAGDEIQIGKYHLTLFIGDK